MHAMVHSFLWASAPPATHPLHPHWFSTFDISHQFSILVILAWTYR